MIGDGSIHATALALGRDGLVITGEPGAGKSTLARDLIDQALGAGRWAALVADDRVLLAEANGRIVARAPTPTRGLIEVRGIGVLEVPIQPAVVVTWVAALDDAAERLPAAGAKVDLAGIAVPVMRFPRCAPGSASAIRAALAFPRHAD